MELFPNYTKKSFPTPPLAARMRPENLDKYFGQEHLIAEGLPLRELVETDSGLSFILWGPPGTGKTTLSKKIQQSDNTFKISVSHTTRHPRANEVDGVDYYFINK